MKKISKPDKREKFLKKLSFLLLMLMFVMIACFFTWSENVMITRLVKIVGRFGTTIGIIMVFRMIVKFGALGTFRWRNNMSPFLYVCYLLLGLASFMWSTDVGYSALQWFMDIECLVFAYYFMRCMLMIEEFFPDSNIRFFSIIGNTSFLLLMIFMVGMVVNPSSFFREVEGGEDSRLGGYIMNPNELGMLCGLGISCLIFDLYRKKQKWYVLGKIMIILYALIITKSRSSLVGLLIIIFFHLQRSQNKLLKLGIYVGLAAVIPVAVQKLIMRKGGIDDILSMTGRMPFWKALINEGLPREPLLGFGFMRIDYKDTFSSVHSYTAHMTHNTFMQVLMNLGFIGFTLALFQLYFTIRGFTKEGAEKKLMLLGILIPVIINSFTEFGIFGEANYSILFYQLLIFNISFEKSTYYTMAEKVHLYKRRPELRPPVRPPNPQFHILE